MNLLNEDNVVHIFLSKIGDLVVANLFVHSLLYPRHHHRTGHDSAVSLHTAHGKRK